MIVHILFAITAFVAKETGSPLWCVLSFMTMFVSIASALKEEV